MTEIMVPYRSNRPLLGCACQPAQMNGLGMSLLTKVLRISTPGPNAVKLKSTPDVVKKAIAVAGPALSVFGPWGKVASVGAAVITVADQRMKAQRLAQAASSGNTQDLVTQYQDVAGKIPGRVLGLPMINQIWAALVSGRAKAADAGYVINSCAKCTAGTVKDQTAKALSQGITDPAQILDQLLIPEMQRSNKKGTWTIPTNDLERQILIDAIDATAAQSNPNFPLTYGQAAPDQPATPVPAPSPVNPVVTPMPAPNVTPPAGAAFVNLPPGVTVSNTPVRTLPNGTPLYQGSDGQLWAKNNSGWFVVQRAPTTLPPSTSRPSSTPTSLPATVPPDQTNALIQQLIAQGASRDQAMQAALQSLAAQGVQATPQVQQQVASDVAAASQPQQASTLYLALGTAAMIGVGILMSRRKEKRR